MKEPQIFFYIDGAPRPVIATVDTGSQHTFVSARFVPHPKTPPTELYEMGGKTWKGWIRKTEVRIADGCSFTAPEVFIAKDANFNVLGTDVLQGLRCKVNLKTERLVCPRSPKIKGCTIPMTEAGSPNRPVGKRGIRRKRR